jgi:hypothetical protein
MKPDIQKRVEEHGKKLLAIFRNAKERDPLTLCRKLRSIEASASSAACAACNDQAGADAWPEAEAKAERDANALLGTRRVWVHADPRGYALKVDLKDTEDLHRDWGGYGIIAPDLTEMP